jgi:hypothetical protein
VLLLPLMLGHVKLVDIGEERSLAGLSGHRNEGRARQQQQMYLYFWIFCE